MWQWIMQGGAWLLLIAMTLVQLAGSLVSEPYVPLKPGQYRLEYAGSHGVGAGSEEMGDVRVFVRHDIFTPIPIGWTSSISLLLLILLWPFGSRPGSG